MSVAQRNARIDVLRGVSILLVLFHHFNIAYPLKDTVPATIFATPVVQAIARNGNYGVTIFFVISGYLMTANTLRRWGRLDAIDARRFYALRAWRILPCMFLLLAMVSLLAALGGTLFQNRGFGEPPLPMWMTALASLTFWMNVLIAQHGWVNYPLGVLWSLSVEGVFYLAFPVVCLTLRRPRFIGAFCLLFIVAGPLYRLAHQGDEGGFLYAYLACFDGIAIGCCTAILVARGTHPWISTRWLQCMTILAMALLYLCWPISRSNVLGVTAMALGTALLLAGASGKTVAARSAGYSFLAFCGGLSYEIYLFHLIVLGLMRTAIPPITASSEVKLGLLAGYLICSLGVACAVARFFSRPFNRLARE
ncbi:acyltransferase family protein [Herbaspirillum seropedicae]|uniref:acyltransferase family protein n=1 Tax=Herbaspirillum seropedicae TaxID=964 RepID=UPI000847F8D2|nr:acyltransferase [Herbaspirillum seropedicae]AON55943.1 acetyltransferase [Herbaspirillum seropedicae]